MACEMMDGFDHYSNSQLPWKWDTTASGIGFVAGRFGGNAYTTSSNALELGLTQGQLAAVGTRTIGFAFQLTGTGYTGVLWQFMDGGSEQCSLRIAGNTFTVNRGSTVLATAPYTLTVNLWVYVEFQVTIGTTTGAYTLKVWSGASPGVWLTASGVNTQSTSNTTTNGVLFQVGSFSGAAFLLDDIYILNSSGPLNNTFLGECRIYTTLPNADDTATPSTNLTWTPDSGAAHFSRVNEASPDGDTSYVYSTTAGQIDTYKYPAISPTGTVAAVQVTLSQRKDDAGTRTTCVAYRGGGTNYIGANNFAQNSSYLMNRQIFETDPATTAPWTASGINTGEFGIKCIA